MPTPQQPLLFLPVTDLQHQILGWAQRHHGAYFSPCLTCSCFVCFFFSTVFFTIHPQKGSDLFLCYCYMPGTSSQHIFRTRLSSSFSLCSLIPTSVCCWGEGAPYLALVHQPWSSHWILSYSARVLHHHPSPA